MLRRAPRDDLRALERRAWLDPVAIAAGLVVAWASALRAAAASTRGFNPDEFEHLHGAWSIAHGLWPYRDYFEHHTPWLWLAIAPFFALVDVDHDPDRAVGFVLAARAAMWILGSVALALTFRLGQLCAGTPAGWLAAAVLSVTLAFVGKTVEIRPDVPALVCLLGSWVTTVSALRHAPNGPGSRWRLGAAGFLLGAAILFTQKALFTLPATIVLLLWWVVDRRQSGSRRARAAGVVVLAAGMTIPVAVTLAVFAAHTGIAAFVEFTVLLNAAWRVRFSPLPSLQRIFEANPPVVCLAILGLVRASWRLGAAEALRRGDALLVLQTLALLVGAFAIPVPQLQYFLMVLPLGAILAGQTLVDAAEALMVRRRRLAPPSPAARAAVTMLGLAIVAALPLAALAKSLQPAYPKMQDQLARMRLVLALTRPSDTVMDGFTGAGVFRPHAYYYFFLHDEIRALLGGPELDGLRRALRDGEIAPALVLFDLDVQHLSREVKSFVEENYEPAGDPLVWRRRDLALDGAAQGRLDVGRGPTAVLVGRGWAAAEEVDGRWLRRTQGRRSTVRVPLRRPADLLLVVHASAEAATSVARLGLVVNDAACGERPLIAGWSDYEFRVPAAVWRAGVNRVRLTHATGPGADGGTPEAEGPGLGSPVGVAVESLRLLPAGPIPGKKAAHSY